MNISQINITTR